MKKKINPMWIRLIIIVVFLIIAGKFNISELYVFPVLFLYGFWTSRHWLKKYCKEWYALAKTIIENGNKQK